MLCFKYHFVWKFFYNLNKKNDTKIHNTQFSTMISLFHARIFNNFVSMQALGPGVEDRIVI